MLTTAATLAAKPLRPAAIEAAMPTPVALRQPAPKRPAGASIAGRIAETLQQIDEALAPQRRVVHAGDPIYRAGDGFGHLYLLNSGLAKVVGLSADGREQVVGLKFRGDWLGFDGIASDRYTCDAIAMDTEAEPGRELHLARGDRERARRPLTALVTGELAGRRRADHHAGLTRLRERAQQ